MSKTGKIRPTIEARKAKGYGILTNVLAIINEVPLGHWKIDAGLQLRQAMLLNCVLFNSEALHNVSQDDLNILEKVDEALLRGILKAHSKIPLEALFLETSSIPIRLIVAGRRLMYLHTILQKSQSEMIRKVYDVQKSDTSPGDFSELVSNDKKDIELNLSDSEIQRLTKTKFKKILKTKINQAAFKYLTSLKQGHSKMDGISYTHLEKASYLNSPLFNSESSRLLLALRTRTVNGIKNDFRGLYADIKCPLMCGEDDKLQHILECSVLKSHHTSSSVMSNNGVSYEDVFSSDVSKQKQVTELYQQLLEIRSNLIKSQPEAVTGPVHCV